MELPRSTHRFPLFRLVAILLAVASASAAHAQLRVVTWNIARIKGDPDAMREVFASLATDDIQGFAAAPHVVILQEVPSTIVVALEAILDSAVPGIDYTLATYTTSAAENQAGGAVALFYRADTVAELTDGHVDIPTGAGRNTDRWHLKLVGYSSPLARFFVYGSHLKAGPGGQNEAERLAGAQAIRANADALPVGTHIVYAGDFNLYSHLEPAYATFLGPGPGQAFDALGTSSWAGPANALKHTQSPRDIAAGGLVGGGLDDRFDFQLSSAAFHDGAGLSIVPGSTRSVGNDGLHYNLAVNAGNNAYFPGQIARSNALADALFAASDHLPVLVDYRVPAVVNAALAQNFGRAIQNATLSVNVLVQNIAAGAPAAIDPLLYEVAGFGALSGFASGVAPVVPGTALVALQVQTGNVGFISGSAVVTALSQAAENALQVLPISGQIVRASNASFSATEEVNALSLGLTAPVGSSLVPITVPMHNFGFDANQARLDVDAVLHLGAGFALAGPLPNSIADDPAAIVFSFDATGKPAGSYSRAMQVLVSDENIPGATGKLLPLTLTVHLVPSTEPADLDGNGVVDAADLAILLGQWGTDGSADLNDDGVVDAADLAILLGAWDA